MLVTGFPMMTQLDDCSTNERARDNYRLAMDIEFTRGTPGQHVRSNLLLNLNLKEYIPNWHVPSNKNWLNASQTLRTQEAHRSIQMEQ